MSCGGNHFNRNGGTETQRSTFVLRNLSDDGAIFLKRVRVYNAGGAMIFDSATGAVGKQYSRAHSACRTTSLKPFNYYR